MHVAYETSMGMLFLLSIIAIYNSFYSLLNSVPSERFEQISTGSLNQEMLVPCFINQII